MVVSGGDVVDGVLIFCPGVRGVGRRHQLAEVVENLADEDDDGPPACVVEDRRGRAVLMHGGIVGDGRG